MRTKRPRKKPFQSRLHPDLIRTVKRAAVDRGITLERAAAEAYSAWAGVDPTPFLPEVCTEPGAQ